MTLHGAHTSPDWKTPRSSGNIADRHLTTHLAPDCVGALASRTEAGDLATRYHCIPVFRLRRPGPTAEQGHLLLAERTRPGNGRVNANVMTVPKQLVVVRTWHNGAYLSVAPH